MSSRVLANVTGVAIGGRALLIEGVSGSGKSSLALALIDRGATLIGDDAITVTRQGETLHASPPPNTEGLLEVRNVGVISLPATTGQVALLLTIDPNAPRYPLELVHREIEGIEIPELPFAAGDVAQAMRAEYALNKHGRPND